MPSRENEDDTERQDRLAVSEEVRIRNLVGMAKTMTDIVLNAEALLDEYVTAFLQREQSDAYTLLRKLGMTPEQKFHIAMGYTGIFNVIDCDARIMMAFLRELYRIRAMMCSEL